MDFVWFMRSREETRIATVFLIARYGEFRGHPQRVKALELLVGMGEMDPNARKLTLISGEQDDIFSWLVDREHQSDIVRTARRMLAEYESKAGS